MAGEPVVTIIGNLTADPELAFTQSGLAVANFTVASTPRTFDRQSGEWREGEALFMRCSVWREYAENAAESLSKGMRVIVNGRLKQRSFDAQDGSRRTVVEMDVDEIGPSLRYATAQVNKTQRSGGGQRSGGNGGSNTGGYNNQGGGNQGNDQGGGGYGNHGGGDQQRPAQRSNAPQNDDPWSTGPAGGGSQQKSGDWGGTFDEEPPF